MSATKGKQEASVKPRHGTITFSVRIDAKVLEDIQREAELLGYSTNQFFIQAAQDAVYMINSPSGKAVRMPKLVMVGRFLKANETTPAIG